VKNYGQSMPAVPNKAPFNFVCQTKYLKACRIRSFLALQALYPNRSRNSFGKRISLLSVTRSSLIPGSPVLNSCSFLRRNSFAKRNSFGKRNTAIAWKTPWSVFFVCSIASESTTCRICSVRGQNTSCTWTVAHPAYVHNILCT